MTRSALQLRQVIRSIQIVALAAVVAVLGASQCLELCSFGSCDRSTHVVDAEEQTPPCHQQSSPNDRQAPTGEACTHQEIVAEKLSFGSSPNHLEVSSFAFVRVESALVEADLSPLVGNRFAGDPGVLRLSRPSVLRI